MTMSNDTPPADDRRGHEKRRREVFVSRSMQGNVLTHPPMLEIGWDHQVRVAGRAGDGVPILADVEVVLEATRLERADLVVLTTERLVYLMSVAEFDEQITEHLDSERLEFRMRSKTPVPAGVYAAVAAVEERRLHGERDRTPPA